MRKICKDLFLVSSSRDRLKKIFWRPFFWRTLASVSLVLGLGLKRVCPWPRNFFMSLASSLVFSTPPLVIITNEVPVSILHAYVSLPRHIRNGVLISRSITSDLSSAIFPSLSIVLSLCDVQKTLFLVNLNGGHKQPFRGTQAAVRRARHPWAHLERRHWSLPLKEIKKRGLIFLIFVSFFLTWKLTVK